MDSLKLGLGLVKPVEDLISSNTTTMMVCPPTSNNTANTCITTRPQMMTERKARPQKEQPINCPRCNSTNTKFCYYNNYSLTQPRYFCKSCRRYWTEGGTLRSVPVGGGSRKNKKHPSTSSNLNNTVTTSSASAAEVKPAESMNNPSKKLHAEYIMLPQDLNLAFNHPSIGQLNDVNDASSNPSGSLSELLRSEIAGRSIGNYVPMQLQMPMPIHEYQQQPIGFGMHEFSQPLGFSLDGVGGAAGNYGNLQAVQARNTGRLLFPFEQLKPAVPASQSSDSATHFEQNRGQVNDQVPPGFWQGMLSGGEGSW